MGHGQWAARELAAVVHCRPGLYCPPPRGPTWVQPLVAFLRNHDLQALRRLLRGHVLQHDLERLVGHPASLVGRGLCDVQRTPKPRSVSLVGAAHDEAAAERDVLGQALERLQRRKEPARTFCK